jgi:hypothetical protein
MPQNRRLLSLGWSAESTDFELKSVHVSCIASEDRMGPSRVLLVTLEFSLHQKPDRVYDQVRGDKSTIETSLSLPSDSITAARPLSLKDL